MRRLSPPSLVPLLDCDMASAVAAPAIDGLGLQIGAATIDVAAKKTYVAARRAPYDNGQRIVAVVKPAFDQSHRVVGLSTDVSIHVLGEAKFAAISHMWGGTNIRDHGQTEIDYTWTVVHDTEYFSHLTGTFTQLVIQAGCPVAVWIDLLCLPQAIDFSGIPGVFASMSFFYRACERCVAIPAIDADSPPSVGPVYFSTVADSTVKSEALVRYIENDNEPRNVEYFDERYIADVAHLLDGMRAEGPNRRLSIRSWQKTNFLPYRCMRDCLQVMGMNRKLFTSEYFSRVWIFQEMMLPNEIFFSIR
ncbi:hypothetical protein HK405_015350 [Cladochytrium tenue]|nr:hypothetical protein HK405_015350 [Cladochytrium tenue]